MKLCNLQANWELVASPNGRACLRHGSAAVLLAGIAGSNPAVGMDVFLL